MEHPVYLYTKLQPFLGWYLKKKSDTRVYNFFLDIARGQGKLLGRGPANDSTPLSTERSLRQRLFLMYFCFQ